VRKALLVCLSAALAAVPLALGQVTDRVQVGVAGRNVTRGFSPALFVQVASPPDYAKGCCYDGDSGQWVGPRYQTQTGNLGGDSSIDWGVAFESRFATAEAAARGKLIHGYPDVASGATTVPHLVGGRNVGSIPAFMVLTAEGGNSARHEGALAFPLGRRVYAIARFAVFNPSSVSAAPFGDYTVKGVLASTWNRDQATTALAGIALEGNLPPARVTARAAGRRVRGAVSDSLGGPLAGVRVTLERRSGARWRSAATGSTTATGTYSLAALRPGSYRVSATLAGSTARSGVVRTR
jgi:hypothetical protein